MKIKVFRALWGIQPQNNIKDVLKRIEDEGYDGMEAGVPYDEKERELWKEAFRESNLDFIGQMWSRTDRSGMFRGVPGIRTPEDHIKMIKIQIDINLELNPLYIDAQMGRDYFSFEGNLKLMEETHRYAQEKGVKVCFETHRCCFSFTPFVMAKFLDAMPWMRLTADLSNWCCVSETMLEDQVEDVEYALSRSDHIHARVGHEHGPQINDPRCPEWKYQMDIHLKWWETIVNHHKKKGSDYLVFTPEFGPVGYMPGLPFTRQPVADNWLINAYMKDLIRERFS